MQQAVRDALIAFMAASAQAQAEVTKEAQRAGIEHARARKNAYRGRKPSFTRDQLAVVRNMLGMSIGATEVAKATGLSRQAVYRIEADLAGAEGMLASWGL